MSLITVSLPQVLTVKEGESIQIPVTKTGIGACSVRLRTSGVSATTPLDYENLSEGYTVAFTDTQMENVGLLVTLPDELVEGDEVLTVWAMEPENCVIMQPRCEITIVDANVPPPPPKPETPPVVSILEKISGLEGTELAIPLTKSGPGACQVSLVTAGDTARTQEDYTGYGEPRVVTFEYDQAQAMATLPLLADTLPESDEMLRIYVKDPVDCTIGNGMAEVTIVEDPTKNPPVETPPTETPGGEDPTLPKNKYPRAVGFATAMPAGTGKPFYRVTNLNDGGPGSLREAIKGGNRMVVFEIGGCIKLKSTLIIDADNITIAGQTAPGQGITIQGKELQVKASFIRVQHINFERGHDPSNLGNADCLKVCPGADSSRWSRSNIHFDHCSFAWGLDETIEIWPASGKLTNVSFTNCVFAEPLWRPQKLGFAPHEKVKAKKQGEHNYGMLIGFNVKKVDVQYSLFTEMYMRCPFIDHGTSTVIANNILQNVRMGVTIQQNRQPAPTAACLVNCQGILVISGPQSSDATGFRFHSYADKWPNGSAVYVSNLYGWKGANGGITPGTHVMFTKGQPVQGPKNAKVRVSAPPIQPPGHTIKPLEASELFDRVVTNSGPMPKLAKRPAAVARIMKKLATKTSGWVDHQSQVGGFSAYPSVSRKLEHATLPDGTPIPLPRHDDEAGVRKWLDTFNSLVSYD
jgi:Calx-beta domain-containing protein